MADNNDSINQPSEPQEEPETPINEEDLSETALDDIAGGFNTVQNITEVNRLQPGIKGNNFQKNKGETWGIIME